MSTSLPLSGARPSAPSILYLPASGPAGVGEYMRCLMVARAVERRWPGARARFMVNRQASYARDVPFPTVLLDSSPTHAVPEVTALIREERPEVVIFDSSGRVAQLAAARQAGAATVFVSSRPNARRKGLRLRRLRLLDQHWIPQPAWATDPPTLWERLKKQCLKQVETLYLGPLFEENLPEDRQRTRATLGLAGRPYVVFTAGGGGSFSGRANASDLMLAVAGRLAAAGGLTCVVILGPNYASEITPPPGVIALRQLPNADLMDLLRDAELVITGGGAVLLQALTLGRACVAVPIANDQPARIARARELGLVVAAEPSIDCLEREAAQLLQDATARERQVANVQALGLRNGLDAAVDALARLTGRG